MTKVITRLRVSAAVALCAVLCACGGDGSPDAPDATDRLRVFVSVLPQAYIVERVGGDLVEVNALVQPWQSAETYEVTPRQMDALSRAQLYFRAGMPFENALLRKIASTCPQLRVVDTREGVALLADTGCAHGDDHADHADHDDHDDHASHADHNHGHMHGDWDPHIWMDPKRVKTQAATVAAALSEAFPEARATFAANLAALERDLDAAHERIAALLSPFHGRRIYVYHPAYAYFADAFGLEQVSVEFEGKEPGPRRVQQIVDGMKAEGARVIFVQPQFSRQMVESVAQQTGAAIVELDPLSKDLIATMDRIAKEIVRSLGDARQ